MTGIKSKRAMAQGAFYAPYIPTEYLSWRDGLHKVYLRATSKYGNTNWGDIESDCMDYLQRNFPGKYHTVKWMGAERKLEPVFKDPKHEMMWKIKYAD